MVYDALKLLQQNPLHLRSRLIVPDPTCCSNVQRYVLIRRL